MAPLNTITIHDRRYLLAGVGIGEAVHLVTETEGANAVAIAPIDRDEWDARPLNPAYDEAELRAEQWAPRTLCGRDGWGMAPTAAGRVHVSPAYIFDEDDTEVAPSCQRCLKLLDRQFPESEPDDQLAAMVSRCVRELSLWNSLLIEDVPVTQMELLRKGIRAECRKRGWVLQTTVQDRRLFAITEGAVTPERQVFIDADARRRMNSEPGTIPRGSWHFTWGT
jgi:hypothetical protein